MEVTITPVFISFSFKRFNIINERINAAEKIHPSYLTEEERANDKAVKINRFLFFVFSHLVNKAIAEKVKK